ncbi:TorF family putative porin [Phreatobacter stygius]|uniref:TorF family putative porin n=1 Tax=Phreatobacter stygius TaxID=1940610 RepID=UPI001477177A|nr:TorF family putative porin [Phreatobacter stygius]
MRSEVLARRGRAGGRAAVIAAPVAVWLAIGGSARAQTADYSPVGSIGLGARGGPAAEAPIRAGPAPGRAAGPVEFSFRAGFASDYIYRGTTLSDRKPAFGAAFEAAFGLAYVGATITSVRMPSQPAAEVTVSGGLRPKLGSIAFDFSWNYFLYPNEKQVIEATHMNYWEVIARADTKIGDVLRVAAGFAYAPNVSNSGSWSKYAAFGMAVDLPGAMLPPDVTATLTGGAGYSWFGNQPAASGGYPFPSYLTWNAGVTFTHGRVNLDLRYYDTNLSRENCFVLTGDPNAARGGRIDPVTNPEGLASRWCSATVVAKLWFALN